MNRNFVVLGDDGEPTGMLDAQQIAHDSTMLAVAIIAVTSDPDQCAELLVEMQNLMDAVAYQYVVTTTLLSVIELLERTLQVADRAGLPFRPILRAITAQLVPDPPTSTTDPEGTK